MRILLGPGASGGEARLQPYVAGLRRRGFDCDSVALPRGSAERALPVLTAAARPAAETVAGGHSFGGRVASLAAAGGEPYLGLLLFSYPLHPPGRPEQWRERTAHWERIACPVLLVSGDRDPFGGPELLEEAVRRLPSARLEVLSGAGHGFREGALEAALDAAAEWLARLRQ